MSGINPIGPSFRSAATQPLERGARPRRTATPDGVPPTDVSVYQATSLDQSQVGGGLDIIKQTAEITLNRPGQFDANDEHYLMGDYHARWSALESASPDQGANEAPPQTPPSEGPISHFIDGARQVATTVVTAPINLVASGAKAVMGWLHL